jgi:hypothetical protein
MIKFFGEPLKEIKSKRSGKVMFVFDTKGEYVTDDPVIIDRAMGFFDYVRVSPGEVGDRVKKTFITPPIVITEKGQEEQEEKQEYKTCKHCGEIHEKPVDYALCAKKHKKEG